MKVNKKTAGIAAAVGVCILATTSLAVYNTGNGYDNLKKAVLGTKDYTNCTIKANVNFSIDGNQVEGGNMIYEYDAVNHTSHQIDTTSAGRYYESYYLNGTQYYRSGEGLNFNSYSTSYFSDTLWGIDSDDEKTANKIIKFMELGFDTVIGDLKNNFVCTESNDEYTAYSISLDYIQIPEIVQAGLGVIGSASGQYEVPIEEENDGIDIYDTPYILGEDPIANSFELNYSTNKDGSFRDGNCYIQLIGEDKNGESHTVELTFDVEISNVGTTVIAPIDVSGAKEMPTDVFEAETVEMEF